MDRYRGVHVAVVAPGHRHGHRHPVPGQKLEDTTVAFRQTLTAQAQSAQAIVGMRVGARQVEGQLWRPLGLTLPGLVQRLLHLGAVEVIVHRGPVVVGFSQHRAIGSDERHARVSYRGAEWDAELARTASPDPARQKWRIREIIGTQLIIE